MNLNSNKIRAILGQPGTAKSTKLVQMAVDDMLMGHQVIAITPTHGSRESLRATIDTAMGIESSEERLNALKELKYKRIKVMYGYTEAYDRIYIEEASQFPDTHFTSLMYRSQHVQGAVITLVGDLKQLNVPAGHSVLELLLSATVDQPVWDWTAEAYQNVDFEFLTAPKSWYLEDTQIPLTILNKNYRLASQGFSNGYDDEYINTVIDKAIDIQSDEPEGVVYHDVVIDAVKNNRLMVALSHKRGQVLNDIILGEFGDDALGYFPFVRDDSKVWLNPENRDYESLKKVFPFVKELDKGIDLKKLELSAYAVPHTVQGATYKGSVLVFLGNEPISKKATSYYTNNNLYVAMSRGTALAQLVGNKDEFRKMLLNRPASMREAKMHLKSEMAVKELFNRMLELREEKTFEEVYGLFGDIFGTIELPAEDERVLEDYNVTSAMYTEDQLRRAFAKYPVGRALKLGFLPNYKDLFYKPYIQSINSENGSKRVGRGKVQLMINSLSEEQREQLKNDVQTLSQRKFKAQYNMTQVTVKKALGLYINKP